MKPTASRANSNCAFANAIEDALNSRSGDEIEGTSFPLLSVPTSELGSKPSIVVPGPSIGQLMSRGRRTGQSAAFPGLALELSLLIRGLAESEC